MNDLNETKKRLFVAADAAYQVATGEEPLQYSTEQYAEVMQSFASMPVDVRTILARLDMYQAMFDKDLQSFLKEENSNGDGLRPDVEQGPQDAVEASDAGGGEATPDVNQGDEGVHAASRPARKRTRRSKPRRNKAEGQEDS